MELNDCAWSSKFVIRYVNEKLVFVIIVIVVVVAVIVVNRKEGFQADPKPESRKVSGTESPPPFLRSGAEMWASPLIFYHRIMVPIP